MTVLFAGALWFDNEDAAILDGIGRLLPESPNTEVFEDRGRSHYLRVLSRGTAPEQWVRTSGSALTLVSGDPVLGEEVFPDIGSLGRDIDYLHEHVRTAPADTLRMANGSFSLISLDPENGTSVLATDKLGVYPVFYTLNERHLVFSSSPAMAGLPIPDKGIDETGLAESVLLGFNQSNRTPYRHVKRLYCGTVVQATRHNGEAKRYWALEQTSPTKADFETVQRDLYNSFLTAVKRRLRGRESVNAFLSGGLDSRCVVAALTTLGADVRTFNISPSGSLDLLLGREFAAKISARHTEIEIAPWETTPIDAFRSSLDRAPEGNVADAHSVWVGEGGSVGLGHVYLNDEIIEAARNGELETGDEIARFPNLFGRQNPPDWIKRPWGRHWVDLVRGAVQQEFQSYESVDKARDVYAWLILNEQRNHLVGHFNRFHQHGTAMIMPFFDADFVARIYSAPVEWFLYHRFYHSWLQLFPPPVAQTPWQSYPGHEACPHPMPEGAVNQFEQISPTRLPHIRREYNKMALKYLFSKTGKWVSKPKLLSHFLKQKLTRQSRPWVWLKIGRIVQAEKQVRN